VFSKAIALGVEYRQARAMALNRHGGRIVDATLSDGSRAARKRSIFYFTTPATLPACPMVIDLTGAYFRSDGAGFICGIAPTPEDDPECFDFELQHGLFDEVLWPTLAARVPGLAALRVQRSWAGHCDLPTLDHNLILGAHPDVHNLLFANGFSGHGLQQSPAVGRALWELVAFQIADRPVLAKPVASLAMNSLHLKP